MMPEEFQNLPDDQQSGNDYTNWSEVIKFSGRNSFDTPTSPLQGAEFWISDGNGKPKRDIEKMQLCAEYAQYALWQLYAAPNTTSLAIEEAEAFVSVGTLMLTDWEAWQQMPDEEPDASDPDDDDEDEDAIFDEDDDDAIGDIPGIIYRKKFASMLDADSPEQQNAFVELPYRLGSEYDAIALRAAIRAKQDFIAQTREANDEARKRGRYRDYGWLIKLYRQGDPDRIYAGAKSMQAPYFLRRLYAEIDASAAGSLRPTNMALVARLLADIASGGTDSIDKQRRQQRRPSNAGGAANTDPE